MLNDKGHWRGIDTPFGENRQVLQLTVKEVRRISQVHIFLYTILIDFDWVYIQGNLFYIHMAQ